jgi:spermidine synthase
MPDTQKSGRPGLKIAAPRSVYFTIFALSGFSGLIYESIWSHYMKLFLGHAAYAQSLVLIIFMGGMAIGSWFASKFSARLRIPILAYAAVEAIVGVVALLFHDLFAGLIEVFHASVLPAIGSPLIGIVVKWMAAGLLILPQSILLGMTFPLMSSGIIRRFPETPGRSIAMLYFTNSIGAAIGVLASGFLMIRAFGLPGTIVTAGLLNIALAITVWVLVRLDPSPETEPLPVRRVEGGAKDVSKLFLLAAFITGAASFIYEISWIRMLSLVLGATTHSFELMLSAFITGLAFGGLWIKRKIDSVADPVRFSGFVQLIMGAFALLTIPVYVMTFDWMVWLRTVLQDSDTAFAAYSVASHAIALAVMLPTTFMAGMTLPLFTFVLLKSGGGEASIGRIYASNTVGAIIGVLFAVHIGLPFLGLKHLIVFGALLDIALGLLLLLKYADVKWRSFRIAAASGVGLVVCGSIIVAAGFDESLLASGVYRNKQTSAAANDNIEFYRDGKTASVVFRTTPGGLGVLATNGKPDASIQLTAGRPASLDEATMTVAAALPMAFAPNAKRIANIGLGSGLTAHVILGNDAVEVLDTIEIEVEMVNASRNFGAAVQRVYDDPRSHIHIEDAKTYFSLNNSVYDIIIAEPSNPWVSGVSSLFSSEFYATAINHLADDGLFVQWIQMYEFSDDLAVSILKALSTSFEDYRIFLSNSSDVILVAKKRGQLGSPDWDLILRGEVGRSLARVGISTASDLDVRQSASRANIIPFLEDMPVPANSDYFPYVDLNAGKAMFMGSSATLFSAWMTAPLPVLEMLNRSSMDFASVSHGQALHRAENIDAANWLFEKITKTKNADPQGASVRLAPPQVYNADWLVASQQTCSATSNPKRWFKSVFELLSFMLPNLDVADAELLVYQAAISACELVDQAKVRAWLDLYHAVATRDAEAMFQSGSELLHDLSNMDAQEQAYVISATMLGAIVSGNPRDAFKVWTDNGVPHYKGRRLPSYVKVILSLSARFDDAT